MYPARPKSRANSGMTRQNPRLALTQISPRARTDIVSESVSPRALSVSREWKKTGIPAQIVKIDSRAQDKGAWLDNGNLHGRYSTHNVILKVLLMKVAIVSNDVILEYVYTNNLHVV